MDIRGLHRRLILAPTPRERGDGLLAATAEALGQPLAKVGLRARAGPEADRPGAPAEGGPSSFGIELANWKAVRR